MENFDKDAWHQAILWESYDKQGKMAAGSIDPPHESICWPLSTLHPSIAFVVHLNWNWLLIGLVSWFMAKCSITSIVPMFFSLCQR